MVYRAHTLRWTPQIYQAVLNQVQRWKRAGNPVVGIKIDFDARTRYLDEYQNYQHGHSLSERQQFVGELTGERRDGLAEVEVKNRFQRGDSVELMTPRGNLSLRVEDLRNAAGEAIEVAPGNGHVVYLALPEGLDLCYALLMRDLQPGQDTRQPQAERSGGCAGKGACGCAH